MRHYPLTVKKPTLISWNDPISNGLLFTIATFFVGLTIGIIALGNNYEFVYFAVLSIYAAFIGFIIAKSFVNQDTTKTQTTNYLQIMAKEATWTSLLIDNKNGELLHKNEGIYDLSNGATSLQDLYLKLKLHPIDQTTLEKLLLFKERDSFTYTFRMDDPQSTDWIQIDAFFDRNQQMTCIHLTDVSKAKRTSLIQNQYIREMENIIRQQQNQPTHMQMLGQLISAHDLKEPLRTIKTYVRLIEKQYQNQLDTQGQEYLQFVSNNTYRMYRMVDDMLAFSGFDHEDTNIQTVHTDILVQEVLSDIKGLIQETNAQIELKYLPVVPADRKQLKHLLQNLLENAIKYSLPNTPHITIDVLEHENEYLFAIKDNGIGIEKQYQRKIFEFFNRGNIRKMYKGTGLGLAICKRIVDNHNGTIWAESDGIGEGSTFYFVFPKNCEEVLVRDAIQEPHAVALAV